MTQWIALSRSRHAQAGFVAREGYHHAQGRMAVPVMVAELSRVLPHYALGFLPGEQGMVPMALLGCERGSNLYLHDDGRWMAPYVPAKLRGYPFALSEPEQQGQALCLAEEHLAESGANPLFEAQELADEVARTLAFLKECERSHRQTLKAARALEEAGVLVPWKLTLPLPAGKRRVEGLYRIDEKALGTLESEAYMALRGMPMQLAYAQLFSMSQVDQLVRRASLQAQHHQVAVPEAGSSLFDEDDELRFDFGD